MYLKKNISNHSSFTLGLVHQAMWGGETEKHGNQPQSFSDYLRVVIPRPASKSGFIGEQVNILGNHLGVWDVSYTINRKSKSFKLYYQHPFEDKSGAYQHFFDELKKRKIPVKSFDGLLGFEIINNDSMISSLLYEYINTMYQSGEEPSKPGEGYGWDSYYNHYIYIYGWTNKNRNIANPLFISGRLFENCVYIINNRIKAHHIGIELSLSKTVKNKCLFTLSQNFGTYWDNHIAKSNNYPYKFADGLRQFSGLIQFDFNPIWKNLNGQISYAFDRGDLYSDSDSFLFSISYQFSNLSPSH